MRELGLYIHTPFCLSKCFYCDFASAVLESPDIMSKHTSAVIKDIECQRTSRGINKTVFHSIYFGGGTPSLLPLKELESLLGSIRNNLKLKENLEVSLEANPVLNLLHRGDKFGLSREKIQGYKSLGINRISLGVQSFNDNFLSILGRIHRSSDVFKVYNYLRNENFQVNFDLMYGLPGQSLSGCMDDLKKAVALEPDHISFYELTLSEESVLGKSLKKCPEEDLVISMYEEGSIYLVEKGFQHYEISNFSKAKKCVHNWNCWGNGEFMGVGAGAWSHILGRRYKNTYPASKYIKAVNSGENSIDYSENLSLEKAAAESLILLLRRSEGVPSEKFNKGLGASLFLEKLKKLSEEGLISMENERIFLTPRGKLLSNYVFLELI